MKPRDEKPLCGPRLRSSLLILQILLALLLLELTRAATSHAGPTFGFLEDFSDSTTAGFIGGAMLSNPGTGGADGAGDGYLAIARPDTAPGNLGAFNAGPDYTGNYIAAGVGKVVFQLNDVEADQAFEIHLSIGNGGNFWQYNVGFSPPEQSWAEFEVDLTDSLNFTQTIGTANYTLALTSVDRLHLRHDLAPYILSPDPIGGQVGVDDILLTAEPTSVPNASSPAAVRPFLLPARPNPARSHTVIAADFDRPSEVRLRIVSAAGRIVRELYYGGVDSGSHVFPWDGRDDRGAEVGAGVYLIQLESGARSETGRIAILH